MFFGLPRTAAAVIVAARRPSAGAHPRRDHQLDFVRIGAMREDPRITTTGDRDTNLPGQLE
jgi:hypothetical protein